MSSFPKNNSWFFRLCLSMLLFVALLNPAYSLDLGQQENIADGSGNNISFTLINSAIPAYSFFDQSDGKVYFYQKYSDGWRRESVISGMPQQTETKIIPLDSEVYILVYDPAGNNLRVARRNFNGWETENIASGVSSGIAATECGSSICVAYKLNSNQSIRHSKGKFNSWSTSTVTSGGDMEGKFAIAENNFGQTAIAWFEFKVEKT